MGSDFSPVKILVYFYHFNKTEFLTDYKNIKIGDFSYHLPEERIARYPLAERDSSALLVWQNGRINKDKFKNITDYLPTDSMLVFNNTRVIHARLFFKKETGATIEIFCLEPAEPADYQLVFQQTEKVVWKCMVGNVKKWKDGTLKKTFELNGNTIVLQAKKIRQKGETFLLEFSWNSPVTFAEIIEASGVLPIPPYLNRETEPDDELAYQTIYAKLDGSVASPTAGLHFTENVMKQLADKNITLREITLHVGAGTFKPVKSETIGKHEMHREQVIVSRKLIEELLQNRQSLIAVGTTSVRTLESLYWLGVRLENRTLSAGKITIDQWEPYNSDALVSVNQALKNILGWLEKNRLESLNFATEIIIVPGYEFKLIKGMITNFHQPQSTLLLLIAAFLGENWKEVYNFALKNGFRFLSYGDSNLYLKTEYNE